MEIKLHYKDALTKYGLKESDLPEDAQTGIQSINQILRGIQLMEKNGKKPTKQHIAKLQAFDKWVKYEIIDHAEGTDENDDMPDDDGLIDDGKSKKDTPPAPKRDNQTSSDNAELGIQIDEELKALHESGKTVFTFEDLKSLAPKTYNHVFETYNPEETNGVSTLNYSLIEGELEKFNLTKK